MKQTSTSTRWMRDPRMTVMSVLLVIAVFAGAGLNQVITQTGIAQDRFSNASNYSVIGETYDTIRENYVLQHEFSDEELVWGAARGMVDTLGDTNHSRFLNPEEAKDFLDRGRNRLVGIGISVDLTGDLPVVIYPMKDTPAIRAGILPGDTIVEIDGVDISDMDPVESTELIAGEAGTDVTLKLIRRGQEEPYEVTITRENIQIDPVQYAMLPNNVLWLRLDSFSEGASLRINEGLAWGQDQGMTSVIFDLRGNPGGFVTEAKAVAGEFLPEGSPLFQQLDINGDTVTNPVGLTNAERRFGDYSEGGSYLEGPLVVLVDGNSASASEIVSSALMESERAEVVGLTTAGTGTVLYPFEMSDGSMAVLGIELFLTGYGTDIYKKGVTPTHEVEFSEVPNEFPWFPASLGADEALVSQAEYDELEDPQLHFAFDLLQE